MGGTVFPPCCLTWDQTILEVMKKNGYFLQKVPRTHCRTQCPWPCSRPPLIHTSARDTWTLTGKSGSVFCGVTAPFCWVLVQTRFCLCPSSLFPQPCVSSGGSMVGLMAISSKRAYATPRSAVPRAPDPATGHWWPLPSQETFKHSKAGLAQSLWSLLVHTKFWLNLPCFSGRYGVWF